MSEDKKTNVQYKELQAQLIDSQEALQNLIFQKTMQQLEDSSQIKKTRKEIAKIKTLIHQMKAK